MPLGFAEGLQGGSERAYDPSGARGFIDLNFAPPSPPDFLIGHFAKGAAKQNAEASGAAARRPAANTKAEGQLPNSSKPPHVEHPVDPTSVAQFVREARLFKMIDESRNPPERHYRDHRDYAEGPLPNSSKPPHGEHPVDPTAVAQFARDARLYKMMDGDRQRHVRGEAPLVGRTDADYYAARLNGSAYDDRMDYPRERAVERNRRSFSPDHDPAPGLRPREYAPDFERYPHDYPVREDWRYAEDPQWRGGDGNPAWYDERTSYNNRAPRDWRDDEGGRYFVDRNGRDVNPVDDHHSWYETGPSNERHR
jgi:hypothetical protein